MHKKKSVHQFPVACKELTNFIHKGCFAMKETNSILVFGIQFLPTNNFDPLFPNGKRHIEVFLAPQLKEEIK